MIMATQFTLAIIFMACITFSVRYAFFMNIVRFELHQKLKNLLIFTAPCVLTALLVPIMFQDIIEPEVFSLKPILTSSYFWASIATIIFSVFIRQTLLVIILGMSVFYGLRLL